MKPEDVKGSITVFTLYMMQGKGWEIVEMGKSDKDCDDLDCENRITKTYKLHKIAKRFYFRNPSFRNLFPNHQK